MAIRDGRGIVEPGGGRERERETGVAVFVLGCKRDGLRGGTGKQASQDLHVRSRRCHHCWCHAEPVCCKYCPASRLPVATVRGAARCLSEEPVDTLGLSCSCSLEQWSVAILVLYLKSISNVSKQGCMMALFSTTIQLT